MDKTEPDSSTDDASDTVSSPYPTGYDHVQDITAPLIDLQNKGYADYRIFRDWVDLMLTALLEDDAAYLEIANGYDREELDLFVEAFAELQRVTDEYDVDVLGDVYETLGMSSDEFAQHFTPHSVSEGLAEMNTETAESVTDRRPQIGDPAGCGSGRLLVASAKRVPNGIFTGIDKDGVCAKMAVVNFCLFGIDGYIIHGDAITMDFYNAWKTTSLGEDSPSIVAEADPEALSETFKEVAYGGE